MGEVLVAVLSNANEYGAIAEGSGITEVSE